MDAKYIKASKIITGILLTILVGSVGALSLVSIEQSLANKNNEKTKYTDANYNRYGLNIRNNDDATPDIELESINGRLYFDKKTKEMYQLCTGIKWSGNESDEYSDDVFMPNYTRADNNIKLDNRCILVASNNVTEDARVGEFSMGMFESVFITVSPSGIGYDILNPNGVEESDVFDRINAKIQEYRESNKLKEYKTYLGLLNDVFDVTWYYGGQSYGFDFNTEVLQLQNGYNETLQIDEEYALFNSDPLIGYIDCEDSDMTVKFNKRADNYSLENLEDDVLYLLGDKAQEYKD